jgi:hypothetical protein
MPSEFHGREIPGLRETSLKCKRTRRLLPNRERLSFLRELRS